jgi:cell wall-associated NlpC family hydrolase
VSREGEALAQAALDLVGTRFCLHGRDPASGLDCVGLVAASLRAVGREARAPVRYALRNSDIAAALAFAPAAGLLEAALPLRPGDILLACSGPLQHHLLVVAPVDRFVHAHAGLRRVVATPGPIPWPILRHWRLAASD